MPTKPNETMVSYIAWTGSLISAREYVEDIYQPVLSTFGEKKKKVECRLGLVCRFKCESTCVFEADRDRPKAFCVSMIDKRWMGTMCSIGSDSGLRVVECWGFGEKWLDS